MTPQAIASLVLGMTPPKGVQGKANIELWRMEKAAEIGQSLAYLSILEKATFKTATWI